ncbi:glucosamine-6-phosphate deaminase [Mucilaginibacter pedocola]|uniref:Glucosamine-6-phosphate deaminase n=1 Tax=Mucilaginibacter pedocola TaxID=1792845 RepID=A0A1S9PG11_9SPHI|nr:glucosamine-6-phosphate deaminase [Mucilaginibacter pedocola]
MKKDKLDVLVAENRAALGHLAAGMAANKIKELLPVKPELNIIFAAAPSQNEFLAALVADESIEWRRINAFHMDEYLGLSEGAPQLFSSFLKESIFDKVPFKSVNCINGSSADALDECERYAALLKTNPADIVCMGIGENTHIAFNDPHVANFKDSQLVKIVELDTACRRQQVNDGCFATLADVPQYALTLTVPALIAAPYIFCMVPGKNKARAIAHTLSTPVTELYPSTILRQHPNAVLFTDADSFSLMD